MIYSGKLDSEKMYLCAMCMVAYYSMVLLANPDGDDPPEVHKAFQQLNDTQHSNREVSIVLILHCFQAALSVTYDWKALRTTLQVTDCYLNPPYFLTFLPPLKQMSHVFFQAKQTEELEMLAEKVTDLLETAASAADLCTARQSLVHGIEEIRASLDVTPTGCHNAGSGNSIH